MKNILEILKSKITILAEDFKKKSAKKDKLREQKSKVESYAIRAVDAFDGNPTVFNGDRAIRLIKDQIYSGYNKNAPISRSGSYMGVGMTEDEFHDWVDVYEDDGVLSMAERWFVDININNHIPHEYRDNNWIDLLKDLENAVDYSIAKSELKTKKTQEYQQRSDLKGEDVEQAVIDEIEKNIDLLAMGRIYDNEEPPIEFQSKQFQLAAARINSIQARGAAGSGKDYVSDGIKNNKDIFDLEATDPAKKDSLNAVKAQLTGAISERKIIKKQKQEKLISEANEYAANQKFPGHDWNKPL
jgi:hypothetical protein